CAPASSAAARWPGLILPGTSTAGAMRSRRWPISMTAPCARSTSASRSSRGTMRTQGTCSTPSRSTAVPAAPGTRATGPRPSRRRKAILCEKPMADTLGHADQMMMACQRNGVKLAIGHQRRFLPAYTMARDMIAQGAIGRVSLIQSIGGQGLPNYSSHQTDMFRYLLQDANCRWVMGNVERKTDRFERTTRIEDAAVAVFEFEGGARALILADVAPT